MSLEQDFPRYTNDEAGQRRVALELAKLKGEIERERQALVQEELHRERVRVHGLGYAMARRQQEQAAEQLAEQLRVANRIKQLESECRLYG